MSPTTVDGSFEVGERRAVRHWILAWLGAPILGIVNGRHTVGFETVFGHWVERESWSTVLEQYDLRAGNVWVGLPAGMVVGPELARRLSARQRGPQTLAHDRSKPDPPVKAAPR